MRLIISIFVLLFLGSCSTFEEELGSNVFIETLTPENIQTDLTVISITADSEEFAEMYAAYEEDIEIEGRFNLYRNGELLVSDEEVELEVKGNYSAMFDLKSLGVKFEDKYDNSDHSLIKPETILPHHSLEKVKAIRLRNSGQDYNLTMLKDKSYVQLAIDAGLDLDLAYGMPTVVFVNEKFYGLLNMRTESNAHGMAGLYGAKKKDITLGQVETPDLYNVNGDFDRIDRFADAIENGDVDYLKSEIDLSNFMDYMIFESYIANMDWPYNNVRFYAVNEGKFRFVLFDLDKANTINTNRSPFDFIVPHQKNVISDLFLVLYADADFKASYDTRFSEIFNSGKLSTERFQAIVQRNAEAIEKEMVWQIEKYGAPASMTEWYLQTARLTEMFSARESFVADIIE